MRKVPGVCAQVVHNFVYGRFILRLICAQTAGTLRMVCVHKLYTNCAQTLCMIFKLTLLHENYFFLISPHFPKPTQLFLSL